MDSESEIYFLPAPLPAAGKLTLADRWVHIQARWAIRRGKHRVLPGLYALGSPGKDSPVFVTANYSLSFDALRTALDGLDAYLLVLDTDGINVWCAAGKGTFGTEELVRQITNARLSERVSHRRLILPQLGAPGIAAHEVARRTHFHVEYGPVRAADLRAYLSTRQATPEMRTVRFNFWDRLVLVPVELVHVLLPLLLAMVVLYFLGGRLMAAAGAAAVLGGAVAFPLLLPWLPTKDFSTKGFFLGLVLILPFSLDLLLRHGHSWQTAVNALAILLAFPPVTAFLALNFTGSTPFTSRSGVKHEIYSYIPYMAGLLGTGVLLSLGLNLSILLGAG